MRDRVELQIIITEDGVVATRVVGPPETQEKGHRWYFCIRHLIPPFDQEIQKLLRQEKEEHRLEREN